MSPPHCVAVDPMLESVCRRNVKLGPGDFVGLDGAPANGTKAWHRIDGKNCFLLL
jgi:hypothetical protein